jgi:hypothetical protein
VAGFFFAMEKGLRRLRCGALTEPEPSAVFEIKK